MHSKSFFLLVPLLVPLGCTQPPPAPPEAVLKPPTLTYQVYKNPVTAGEPPVALQLERGFYACSSEEEIIIKLQLTAPNWQDFAVFVARLGEGIGTNKETGDEEVTEGLGEDAANKDAMGEIVQERYRLKQEKTLQTVPTRGEAELRVELPYGIKQYVRIRTELWTGQPLSFYEKARLEQEIHLPFNVRSSVQPQDTYSNLALLYEPRRKRILPSLTPEEDDASVSD